MLQSGERMREHWRPVTTGRNLRCGGSPTMKTIADLLATAAPEPMGRKHDDMPEDKRLHVDLAVDRILHKMSVAQCQVKYGVGRTSVYRFVEYAASYKGIVPEIIHRALIAKKLTKKQPAKAS